MGKGAAKFGYKSGTLPAVRDIFKKPIKPIVRPANPNVGYAEGIKEPRGVQREQPLPKVKSAQQLIHDTVKDPKRIPTNLAKLTEIQREKLTKASLRRDYFKSTLKNEQTRLEKLEAYQAQALKESKQEHDDLFKTTASTELALPTIDNYLNGPIMRQRTPEEEETLKAKKLANRLNHELVGKTNKATKLLSLYYASQSFILTEEELKQRVESVFAKANTANASNVAKYSTKVTDSLFDTVNGGKPGLQQIQESINGKDLLFKEQLKKLAELEKIRADNAAIQN